MQNVIDLFNKRQYYKTNKTNKKDFVFHKNGLFTFVSKKEKRMPSHEEV
jgi:hypothetical protein